MIAEGLLWFDDDPRRPLMEKIVSAVERYSERTGWRPTVCEAHPAQVETFNADLARAAAVAARKRVPKAGAKAGKAPAVQLPPTLRVTPSAAMRPNYFLIGIEAGERPRAAKNPAKIPAKSLTPATPAPLRVARKVTRSASSPTPVIAAAVADTPAAQVQSALPTKPAKSPNPTRSATRSAPAKAPTQDKQVTPASQDKPTKRTRPITEVNLIAEVKQAKPAKQAKQAKLTIQAKPEKLDKTAARSAPAKPTTQAKQAKQATEVIPTKRTKPTIQVKPEKLDKPLTRDKQAKRTMPLKPAKPGSTPIPVAPAAPVAPSAPAAPARPARGRAPRSKVS